MTGRDMLDWFSTRRLDLSYRGPRVWPGLQRGSPDHQQHLVGELSPEDTRRIVLRGRSLLRLPMGDDVVEQLGPPRVV